jgi:hypothetical protein
MNEYIHKTLSESSLNKATIQNTSTLSKSTISNNCKQRISKEEINKMLDDDSVTEPLTPEPSLSSTISDCESTGILNNVDKVYNICEKRLFIQQEPVRLGMEVELYIDNERIDLKNEVSIEIDNEHSELLNNVENGTMTTVSKDNVVDNKNVDKRDDSYKNKISQQATTLHSNKVVFSRTLITTPTNISPNGPNEKEI